MEEILAILRSVYLFSEECGRHLLGVVERKDVKKGDILLRPGEVCGYLHFIKKGLLRCYYLLGEVEVTDWFFWEGDTVVSIPSWYTQTPGKHYIVALEDCELYLLRKYLFVTYVYYSVVEARGQKDIS